jgi:hypothetical protein
LIQAIFITIVYNIAGRGIRIFRGIVLPNKVDQLEDFSPTQINAVWLDKAIEEDKAGRQSSAVDIIFDRVDRLLNSGNFAEVDSILAVIPIEGLTLTFLMALLSITLPASSHLSSRAKFFGKVWQRCIDQGRDAQKLLGGLREWSGNGSGLSRD